MAGSVAAGGLCHLLPVHRFQAVHLAHRYLAHPHLHYQAPLVLQVYLLLVQVRRFLLLQAQVRFPAVRLQVFHHHLVHLRLVVHPHLVLYHLLHQVQA